MIFFLVVFVGYDLGRIYKGFFVLSEGRTRYLEFGFGWLVFKFLFIIISGGIMFAEVYC